MQYIHTFEEHLKHPEVSLEVYAGRKRLELGRELLGTKKIYLDTKYWLLFREVRLGRNANPKLARLLELLTTLEKENSAVCPISADTFLEVLKQTDNATRRVTVQLIDQLSRGICLLEPDERIKLEVLHLVRAKTRGDNSVHTMEELVWTKVAYILGFTSPELDGISAEVACSIEKALVDQMCIITLTDMLDLLGSKADSVPRLRICPKCRTQVSSNTCPNTHPLSNFS